MLYTRDQIRLLLSATVLKWYDARLLQLARTVQWSAEENARRTGDPQAMRHAAQLVDYYENGAETAELVWERTWACCALLNRWPAPRGSQDAERTENPEW